MIVKSLLTILLFIFSTVSLIAYFELNMQSLASKIIYQANNCRSFNVKEQAYILNEKVLNTANEIQSAPTPLDFLNDYPEQAVFLLSQIASPRSKTRKNDMEKYKYTKFLENSKKLVNVINNNENELKIEVHTTIPPRSFNVTSQCPAQCFIRVNNSRHRATIIGISNNNSRHVRVEWKSEGKDYNMDLAISGAIQSKQVILIDTTVQLTIFAPNMYLSQWIDGPYQQKYWLHPAVENKGLSASRYNSKIQYRNSLKAKNIDWLKTQQYSWAWKKTKFGKKSDFLRIGNFYEIKDESGNFKIVWMKGFRVAVNQHLIHESVLMVDYFECFSDADYNDWHDSYAKLFDEDSEEIYTEYLNNDVHPKHALIPNINPLCIKAIPVHEIHLTEREVTVVMGSEYDGEQAGNKPDTFYIVFCLIRDNQIGYCNMSEQVSNWKDDAADKPQELKEPNSHLAEFWIWLDGMDHKGEGILSLVMQWADIDESVRPWMASLHDLGVAPSNIFVEDILRIFILIHNSIRPYHTKINNIAHKFYPYLGGIMCDTKEIYKVGSGVMPTYKGKHIGGKCTVTRLDSMKPETCWWQHPRSYSHYTQLAVNKLHSFDDWKQNKTGYVSPDMKLIKELQNCRFFTDLMYGINMDIGHGFKNGYQQVCGMVNDFKLISATNKPTLFLKVQECIEINSLSSAKIKCDSNFDKDLIFKGLKISQSPGTLIGMQLAWGCQSLFYNDIYDQNKAEGFKTVSNAISVMMLSNNGLCDPRYDWPSVSEFWRDECGNVRKYDVILPEEELEDKNDEKIEDELCFKGFTSWTKHTWDETLLQIPIRNNMSRSNTDKYEKTNKEKHGSINKGAFQLSSLQNCTKDIRLHHYGSMLMGTAGLDSDNKLCFGDDVTCQLSQYILDSEPVAHKNWRALNEFVDAYQYPYKPQYTDGEKLRGKIQTSYSITDDTIKQMILGTISVQNWNCVRNVTSYNRMVCWRHGRENIVRVTNIVFVDTPNIADDSWECYYVQSFVKVKTKRGGIYSIILGSKVKLSKQICRFSHTMIGAPDKNITNVLLCKNIKGRLISCHHCLTTCKSNWNGKWSHDDNEPNVVIHSQIGLGFYDLFSPLISLHKRRLCTQKYLKRVTSKSN
eukprot:476918_1